MWEWILKMFYLGVGVKQEAQLGEFTNLGIFTQNSRFNILTRMLGACLESFLGWLFEALSQKWPTVSKVEKPDFHVQC